METDIKKFEAKKVEEKELQHTGFGGLTTGYEDIGLSLDQHIVDHPASTYFMIAKGTAALDRGIHSEDILVIDKSVDPKNGSIVVACIRGEFSLRRFMLDKNETILLSLNNSIDQALKITGDEDTYIEGVVTHVIHKLK
jgi:DNA polymerase V